MRFFFAVLIWMRRPRGVVWTCDLDNRLHLTEAGDIEWIAQENGLEVTYQDEPGVSFWRRLSSDLWLLVPIEDQL